MAVEYPCCLRDFDRADSDKRDPEFAVSLPTSFEPSSICYNKDFPKIEENPDSDPFSLEERLTDTASSRDYSSDDPTFAFRLNPNLLPADKEPQALPDRVDSLSPPSGTHQHTSSETGLGQGPRHVQQQVPLISDLQHNQRPGSNSTVGTLMVPSLTSTSSITSTNSIVGRLDAMLSEVDRDFYQAQGKTSSHSDSPLTPPSTPATCFVPPSSPSLPMPTANQSAIRGLDESRGIHSTHSNNIITPVVSHQRMKPLPTIPRLSRGECENPKRGISNHDPGEPSPNPTTSPTRTQISSFPGKNHPAKHERRQVLSDNGLFMLTDNNSNNNNDFPVGPVPTSFRKPFAAGPASPAHGPSSTSTCEAPVERSVWEPDTDSESEDFFSKALSKKPMETLRKVRSKVQLRKAKSNLGSSNVATREDEEEEIIERRYSPLGGYGNNNHLNNLNDNINNNDVSKDTNLEGTNSKTSSKSKPGLQSTQPPTVHEKFLKACSSKSSLRVFRNSQHRQDQKQNQDSLDDNPSSPPVFTESAQPDMRTWPWHRYYAPDLSGCPEMREERNVPAYSSQRPEKTSSFSKLPFPKRVMGMFRQLNCYQ